MRCALPIDWRCPRSALHCRPWIHRQPLDGRRLPCVGLRRWRDRNRPRHPKAPLRCFCSHLCDRSTHVPHRALRIRPRARWHNRAVGTASNRPGLTVRRRWTLHRPLPRGQSPHAEGVWMQPLSNRALGFQIRADRTLSGTQPYSEYIRHARLYCTRALSTSPFIRYARPSM